MKNKLQFLKVLLMLFLVISFQSSFAQTKQPTNVATTAGFKTEGPVPTGPTNLVATAGVNAATISFTPPTNNSNITSYQYTLDNGGSWTTIATTTSPLNITGLTNCTNYSIKIRAVYSDAKLAIQIPVSDAVTVTPQNGQQAGLWTSRTAFDYSWNSVTYGNGLFVAVTDSNPAKVMTSPDGITWTNGTWENNASRTVNFCNGLFIALGYDTVMTSPDGITWTRKTSPSLQAWTSVTYGNGLFVAVANSTPTNRVMTSPDGITWTSRTTPVATKSWVSITYGNGIFVATTQPNGTDIELVMTSSDGINWTIRTASAMKSWNSVTYGNGLFVSVELQGTVMTSTDGINWTNRNVPEAGINWVSVTYGNGLFVAVAVGGSGNRIMASPDGINWTSRTAETIKNWRSVAYGNGRFVAVASYGATNDKVMTSSLAFAPDIPTINTIMPYRTSAWVTFTAPASSGSFGITNYEYSIDNGSNWITPSPAVTSSPLRINNLSTGVTYPIKLRAVNSAGLGCASTSMSTTTNDVTAPPTASSQIFCVSSTVANLVADGSNLKWYTALTDGSALASTTVIASGTYYVSQTINEIESTRTAVTVTVTIIAQAVAPSIGDGTIAAPYQIANFENLLWLSNNNSVWGQNFIQTADIDASDTSNTSCFNGGLGWSPIGTFTYDVSWNAIDNSFYGVYNGQGHTISNLMINRPTEERIGLFGRVGKNSVGLVTDVHLINANINAMNVTGVLVGQLFTKVEKSSATGTVTSAYDYSYSLGGIVGQMEGGSEISLSSANVAVSGTGTGASNFGGLCGSNSGTISNSYALGSVSAASGAGGFVGNNSRGIITNCYSTGSTVATTNGGGFVGVNSMRDPMSFPWAPIYNTGTINYCFWDSAASGISTSDGGTSKTTLEMKTATTFTNWDFSTIWSINTLKNSGYPDFITQEITEAPTASAQTFCGSKTVADLTAIGTDLQWYDIPTGVTALTNSTTLATGTYYVSQIVNSVESERTSVAITVNNAVAGTVSAGQLIVRGTKPAAISLTGSVGTVQWQVSLGNSTFKNIVGATSSTLTSDQMGVLTSKKFYRAVLNTSCNSATSEVVQVWTTLATKIQDSQCGKTLASLTTIVSANSVPGANKYRFKVVNSTTTKTIETTSRGFSLTALEDGFLFNTTYTISVATQSIGLWSEYGDPCNVTTPSGITKIQNSQCGQTLASLTTNVMADAVAGVTNYRFKVVQGETTRFLETKARYFNLKSLEGGVFYNTNYKVSVATQYNGNWSAYGTECTVTTPSGLTKIKDSQCGTTLASLSTNVVANAVAGVSLYSFKVVQGGTTRTIEKVAATFSLKTLVGGALNGTTYTISVATKYNGVWGNYGAECMVTTPGTAQPSVSRQAATATVQEIVSEAVSVVAYPNPFDATFKLDFQSSSDANILVSVYDMNGRLLENQEVKSSEINNLELGNGYPSGVYNAIITQETEVKTIRVIKK